MAPSLTTSYTVPSAGADTTTLTSSAFSPSAGEVIVVKLCTWDTAAGMNAPTDSLSALTFTHVGTAAPGGFNGWTGVWVCKVGSAPGSLTISAAPTTGSATRHTMFIERWSSADLAATPATNATVNGSGSTTASTTLTTTAADSVVSWAMVDEQSRDPAGSSYITTSGTVTQQGIYDGHVGSNSVHYSAYQTAATAGSNTFGITSSIGTLTWVAVGVEVLAAATATPVSDSDTGSGADAVSALVVTESSTDAGSGADVVQALVITESSADTFTGAEVASVVVSISDTEIVSANDSVSAFSMTSADSATTAESSSLSVSHSAVDSGSAVDAAALAVNSPDADSGIAVESATVTVSITDSDTVTAVENASVFDGSTAQRSATDSAVATEASSLTVQLSASETITVTEAAGRDQSPNASEGVSSVENAFVTVLPEKPPTVRPYPYFIRETQAWAIEQERRRHNEALYQYGESTMFCLMWHILDFNDGLVGRCPTCYESAGEVADVYGQPSKNKCPDCFGTSFEGGFKAIIVRPAIFSDSDESENLTKRGLVHPQKLSIDSTPDFRIRTGDYCFRATGERYYLRAPERVTVRSGFGEPSQISAAIAYNHANAAEEDPTSVAYKIPPRNDEIAMILGQRSRVPRNWSRYEVIRAPLIPDEGDRSSNWNGPV